MKRKEKMQKGAAKGKKKSIVYDSALDKAEKLEFAKICEMEGIDEEIALLRIKIREILRDDPDDVRLMMEAANTLSRLIRTRYKIAGTQKKGLKEAMANVVKDVLLPLGITVLNKKI